MSLDKGVKEKRAALSPTLRLFLHVFFVLDISKLDILTKTKRFVKE